MSQFICIQTLFKRKPILLKALEEYGFKGKITTGIGLKLRDFVNGFTGQYCEIRIDRRHLSHVSNDVGFRYNTTKQAYELVISEFDNSMKQHFDVGKLKQIYAQLILKEQSIIKNAGLNIKKSPGGDIEITIQSNEKDGEKKGDIKANIDNQGNVEMEVLNSKGTACAEVTKEFEEQLGKVVSRDYKPEYYEEEEIINEKQKKQNIQKIQY